MIAHLILAGMARCVTAQLCPTDDELIAALKRETAEYIAKLYAQQGDDNSEYVLLLQPRLIKGVSNVLCGEPFPAEQGTIICRFTVRYSGHNSYRMARVHKGGDG